MFKRILLSMLVLALLPMFTFAQNRALLRSNNALTKLKSGVDIQQALNLANIKASNVPMDADGGINPMITGNAAVFNPNGTIDTLNYPGAWSTTKFNIYGQDWLLQWFVAPADLTIKEIGFSCLSNVGNNTVEMKVVKFTSTWTLARLLAQYANAGNDARYQGYYPAVGNLINDITAFSTNPDVTGAWVSKNSSNYPDPFADVDVWSDGGIGMTLEPLPNGAQNYQFVKTNILAEPQLLRGEIFAIAIRNNNPITATTQDNLTFAQSADSRGGYFGWKYHALERNTGQGDPGWWSRATAYDFACVVDLTGDTPPDITNYTKLGTTLSTAPRTVSATITDGNPSGGTTGVQSAKISYTIDGGTTWNDVPMVAAGDVYSADIPGQAKGTTVTYKIAAVDVNATPSETPTVTYKIYVSNPENQTLIVFNGYTAPTGYPQSYYFGYNGATADASEKITFPSDKWSYGALSKELVDNYQNIFEIATKGPNDINNDVIKEWLAASPTHNYLLAGDEWLGSQTNWVNKTYAPGDFQYDILGIAKDFNDISVVGTATAAMVQAPSFATGVAGTTLGDSLHLKVVALAEDSLWIHPYYEITVQNWLDGFDPVSGTVVDVTAVGKDGTTYNVGAHRTLPAGNKVAFLAFDPLSLDSHAASYFWFGFDRVSPLVQALNWFGMPAPPEPTVEFKVDMSVQMKRGTFSATDSVWVRGNFAFADWSGKDIELKDPDHDSVYTGVFTNFTVGQNLVFKYVHSPDVWESTGNRTLTVAAGPNVTSACWEDVCVYVPTKTIKVAFTVNMELERRSGLFNPATSTVSVRGSFNGWGETMMSASATNADLYEAEADVIAAVDEKVSFKYYYSPGTWESDHMTDTTQNDRYFIVSQAIFDAATYSYETGFNNGEITTVLNQPADIKFVCNTNNRSIINAPLGTVFENVYIAGGNSPLQWPLGGWPDADITKVLQLYDDGTNGDAVAGDKIFTRIVTFPAWSTLSVTYKYGANWGLPTNGGANDNEAGVNDNHSLKMGQFTSSATVIDTFGVTKLNDVTKVEKEGNEIPTVFALAQNYPNPFNPETNIRFSIPQESFVTVKVYNTLGEEVMTLVNEEKTAGVYNVSFNAKSLTSGIYFYSIKANDFTSTKKMILMK